MDLEAPAVAPSITDQLLLSGLTNLLHDRKTYAIVTAMRGPDTYPDSDAGESSKVLGACVIRWLSGLREDWAVGGMRRSPDEAQRHYEELGRHKRKAVRHFFYNNWHYRNHLTDALDALVKMEVEGAKEYREWLVTEVLS